MGGNVLESPDRKILRSEWPQSVESIIGTAEQGFENCRVNKPIFWEYMSRDDDRIDLKRHGDLEKRDVFRPRRNGLHRFRMR
jgi:hypothetical protein